MPRRSDPLAAAPKAQKKIPFAFVLEELAEASPWTRPFFGCVGVYVDEKIVFVLREKGGGSADDGVWVATTREHHASLRGELPSLRSIEVFGRGETGWQVLPAAGDGFEEEVMAACAMVVARDARVGKVPKGRRKGAAR